MQKVMVTGGAGYIGSHTVVALHEAGFEPVLVDNFINSDRKVIARIAQIIGRTPELYEADCTDKIAMAAVMRQAGELFGIIHFAAYKAVGESVRLPLKYYHNNIGSLVVLLELMQDAGNPRLVFSSSCTVYGQPDQLPVTEGTPMKPAESPYGYTKQVCEQLLQDAAHSEQGAAAVILRYFNPIGAHPSGLIGELPLGKPENLVPYVTQTAAGIRNELTIFGSDYNTPDGTCIRDYIHVMDLAEAHVKALQWMNQQSLSEPAIFNLGAGRGHSVKEVVETFEAVTGTKVPHRYGDRRPGDVEQIYADVTRANEVLGWHTKRGLGEALQDAWNWEQRLAGA